MKKIFFSFIALTIVTVHAGERITNIPDDLGLPRIPTGERSERHRLIDLNGAVVQSFGELGITPTENILHAYKIACDYSIGADRVTDLCERLISNGLDVEFLELTLILFNSPEASKRQKALQAFIEYSKNIDFNHNRAKYIFDHFFQKGICVLLNQGEDCASLYEELYKHYKSTHNSYALQRLWDHVCSTATDALPISTNDSSDWTVHVQMPFVEQVHKMLSGYFNISNAEAKRISSSKLRIFDTFLAKSIINQSIPAEHIRSFILAAHKSRILLLNDVIKKYIVTVICDETIQLAERVAFVDFIISNNLTVAIEQVKQTLKPSDLKNYLFAQLDAQIAPTSYELFIAKKKLVDLHTANPVFRIEFVAPNRKDTPIKNIYSSQSQDNYFYYIPGGHTTTFTQRFGNQIYVSKHFRDGKSNDYGWKVSIYNVETGYEQWELTLPESDLSPRIAIDAKNNIVYFGMTTGIVCSVDIKTGTITQEKLMSDGIHDIFIIDGILFVEHGDSYYGGNKISQFDQSLRQIGKIKQFKSLIRNTVVNNERQIYVTSDYEHPTEIIIADCRGDEEIILVDYQGDEGEAFFYPRVKLPYVSVFDNKLFFTHYKENKLYLTCYDMSAKNMDWSYALPARIMTMIVSKDGTKLFMILRNKTMVALSITQQDNQVVWQQDINDGPYSDGKITTLLASADSKTLYGMQKDFGHLYHINVETGAMEYCEKIEHGRIRYFLGEKDGKPIVLGQHF